MEKDLKEDLIELSITSLLNCLEDSNIKDRFVKEISDDDFNIRAVTKSAFTQARAKLNPLAFKRWNEITVNGI